MGIILYLAILAVIEGYLSSSSLIPCLQELILCDLVWPQEARCTLWMPPPRTSERRDALATRKAPAPILQAHYHPITIITEVQMTMIFHILTTLDWGKLGGT